MYAIFLSIKAERQLGLIRKHDEKTVLNIDDKITGLTNDPYSKVKRLVNSDQYTLRDGDYRVILKINNKTREIDIIEIGNRRHVYD